MDDVIPANVVYFMVQCFSWETWKPGLYEPQFNLTMGKYVVHT